MLLIAGELILRYMGLRLTTLAIDEVSDLFQANTIYCPKIIQRDYANTIYCHETHTERLSKYYLLS